MDTNQLAERLLKLRKENGYSQEQLAEELNVSRQAVSKWECGDALPDTENLIALAELYHCSIDEIVFDSATTTHSAEATSAETPVVEPAPEAEDEDVKLTKKQSIAVGTVSAVTLFASIIAYLLCGVLLKAWHPAWIVFFAIPIVPSTVDSIIKKDPHIFPFPVLVVAAYLLVGFLCGQWHPWWVLFLTVPVYYVIIDGIVRTKRNRK